MIRRHKPVSLFWGNVLLYLVVVMSMALFMSSLDIYVDQSPITGLAVANESIITGGLAEDLEGFVQQPAEVGKEVVWVKEDVNETISISTPPPLIEESQIVEESGRQKKTVKVSSDYPYEKVLTFASVPDLLPEQVHLYWMIDGVKTEVTDSLEFNVTLYDENEDGLTDKISWITPHLSEQEFILEFDITVINPWEFGQSGGEWIVYFDTTGTGTLNITKDDLANSVLTFNYLRCGINDISYVSVGQSYVVENYTCSETATISHTIGDMPNEIFSLRFDFGNDLQNDVDFAYDPAMCLPWPTGMPGEPDCSACVPEGFVGFDIDPGVDGVCYSDPICGTLCDGAPNNKPAWAEEIANASVTDTDGDTTVDSDLTASGSGQCTDADEDTLSFSITAENTSQVDCTISTNQLTANPVAGFSGNASCDVECSDGTDTATETFYIRVNACGGNWGGYGTWTVDSNQTCSASGTIFKTINITGHNNLTLENWNQMSVERILIQPEAFLVITNTKLNISGDIDSEGNITLANATINVSHFNISLEGDITNVTLNSSGRFLVHTNGIVNITNSAINTVNTSVNGTLHVDPSTWVEEGIIDVGPGGKLQYVDTGVVVHGEVIVHGGVLDFLTSSILSMNPDGPDGGFSITVRDEGIDHGILTVDSTSLINRNASFNYDVLVDTGGTLDLSNDMIYVRDFDASDASSTITLTGSPAILMARDLTIAGNFTPATSVFNFTGTSNVSNTKIFYDVNLSSGNVNQTSVINIENKLEIAASQQWNTSTSGHTLNVSNTAMILGKLDGQSSTITFGNLSVPSGGTYVATSGTTNISRANVSAAGTITHNDGTFRFSKGSLQTIDTASKLFRVIVDADTVLFTSGSLLYVSNDINFSTRSLLNLTDDRTLTVNGTAYFTAPSNITVSKGVVHNLTVNLTNASWMNGSNFSINAFVLRYVDSNQFKNVSSYINISKAVSASYGASMNINLSYADSNVVDVAEDSLSLWENDGGVGGWTNITGTVLSTSANYVNALVTSFNVFGVGGVPKAIAISLSPVLAGGINWSVTNLSVTDDHNATGNNGTTSTDYFINISANYTNVDVYLKSNGSLVKTGGGSIAQNRQKVANHTANRSITTGSQPVKTNLTSTYTDLDIGRILSDGANIFLKFYLNVPAGTGAGGYENQITIKAVEDGNSP